MGVEKTFFFLSFKDMLNSCFGPANESWAYYAKLGKPDRDVTYMWNLKMPNLYKQKVKRWFPEDGDGEKGQMFRNTNLQRVGRKP